MIKESTSLINNIVVKVPISENEPDLLVDRTVANIYGSINIDRNTVSLSVEIIDTELAQLNKALIKQGYEEMVNAVNIRATMFNFPITF